MAMNCTNEKDFEATLSLLAKLSANLAHDVRNPLSSISATTQVLASKLSENDPRRKYTSMVLKEIERINNIINGVLALNEENYLSISTVNFASIVEKIANVLDVRLMSSEMKIVLNNTLQQDVFSDPSKLEKIFMIICKNSIDAVKSKGENIFINVFNEQDAPNQIIVEFINNGKAIDVDKQTHVFDPFFTNKTRGLGLGLTLAQRYANYISGKLILVESSQEKTVFRLSFNNQKI